MNKGLFCALCCVGVAGYSTVEKEFSSLGMSLEHQMKYTFEASPDFKKIKGLWAIVHAVEEGCRFAQQWKEREAVCRSFMAELANLYEARLNFDQLSEDNKQHIEKINKDIEALKQDLKPLLDYLLGWSTTKAYMDCSNQLGFAISQNQAD